MLSDGGIRRLSSVQVRVEAADGQLAARFGELESEHATASLTLTDEVLEYWRRVIDANALEAHAHQAVCGEVGARDVVSRRGRIERSTSTYLSKPLLYVVACVVTS